MSIELAKLRDGHIAFLTDDPLPGKISAVEYFSCQHYLQISYENEEIEDFLLEQELPDNAITAIESALEQVLIVEMSSENPDGYFVPLLRIID